MTRWAADVSPENVHAEYPRPQLVRDSWQNLNGLWQLAFGEEGDEVPAGRDLPEQILVPFPVESALSGVMRHDDRLWYRRMFDVPVAWRGQKVLLHFGAVDWEAQVFVNGHDVGMHRGGYDAFTLDITEALTDAGPQELIVRVFDPTDAGEQPRGKQVREPHRHWYSSTTGIWQTVWLEAVSPAHVTDLRITPDVDGERIVIEAHCTGVADGDVVEAIVNDGNRIVTTVLESVFITGDDVETVLLELPIRSPKLWTPDSPFLYDLTVKIVRGGDVLDQVKSYFGMRKIELGADENGVTRIMLNGEFVFQVGPLDQGFWPDGLYTAPTDEALRYDVEVMKELGFNMVRKHVKIEPARWYYWCDRLGLLVWQDMPSGGPYADRETRAADRTEESAQQFEKELAQMVRQLYNHPSIVMWVVFNEGWGQYDTVRITEQVQEWDSTRLVCCASGWHDFPVGDIIDRHAYPGPDAPTPTDSRAGVLGEFGGIRLDVDGHLWSEENWGYRTVESPEALAQSYEDLLRGAWRFQEEEGLSACVYTQLTDVEVEANGLLTYDRAVIKADADRLRAANEGQTSKPEHRP